MNQPCGTRNWCSSSAILVEGEHADLRVDKVLEIRRQLGEGRYSIDDPLDVVVERIIEDLREV